MSNFHLQEIQTLQNSLREREEYVTELENRLRALWDKYEVDRKHYMDRIKRLEEDWSGWPALQREWFGDRYASMQPLEAVRARVEDDAERINRLEEAGDELLAALQDDWSEYIEWINESTDAVGKWKRAKEAKL